MGFTGCPVLVLGLVAVESLCLVSSSEEPASAAVAAVAENKWFMEFGPFWRAGGDVDVQVKSLPDLSRYRPPVPPSNKATGPANAVADRTYQDGYVKQDYGTGVWDNNTWYWGYDSNEQIVANQLVFHASTYSVGGESLSTTDTFSLELGDEIGGEARIGRNVFTSKGMSASLVLGLGFTSFGGSAAFEDPGYIWGPQVARVTDTYNLLTDPSQVPPAPYSGTKQGPGYIIPNIPAQRHVGVGRTSSPTEISHSVYQNIDVDLWVLSLGLDVRGKGPKVSYTGGAGLSGNFVSADSLFRWAAIENGVVLDSASYSDDDNAFALGAYAEAGVLLRVCGSVSLGLRARYDRMFGDAKMGFSNTNAEINLSGVSALANLGISF